MNLKIENESPDAFGPEETVAEVIARVEKFLKDRREKREGRVMFSLTSEEFDKSYPGDLQFRCWDGPFGSASTTYFDSCGENLLFSCYADKEEMEQFIAACGVLKHYRKWKLDGAYGTAENVAIWVGQ